MSANFKTDHDNPTLNSRKMLECFCRETYPSHQNRAVVFVPSEFSFDDVKERYSGKLLELIRSVHKSIETNRYYGLDGRIIPVIIDDIDPNTVNDLRMLVYNETFCALWWLGELSYCTD